MNKPAAILDFEKATGVTISLRTLPDWSWNASTCALNIHPLRRLIDWDVVAFGIGHGFCFKGDMYSGVVKLLSGWELRKNFLDIAFKHVIENYGDYISKLRVTGDRYEATVDYYHEAPVLVDKMVNLGFARHLGWGRYELMFPADGLREFIALFV